MFVGSINLGSSFPFDVIVTSLGGTRLSGRWKENTDILMLSMVGSGKFCLCRIGDRPDRYVRDLGISRRDAGILAEWLNGQPPHFADAQQFAGGIAATQ